MCIRAREKDEVKYGPNRTQNRAADPIQPSHYRDAFANERDTDWSLRQHAEWINGLIAAEKEKSGEEIPLVIDCLLYTSFHGNQCFRNELGSVQNIEVELVCVFFRDELQPQLVFLSLIHILLGIQISVSLKRTDDLFPYS